MKNVELELWTLRYQLEALISRLMVESNEVKRKEYQASMEFVELRMKELNEKY
jgi:hypothetical protein